MPCDRNNHCLEMNIDVKDNATRFRTVEKIGMLGECALTERRSALRDRNKFKWLPTNLPLENVEKSHGIKTPSKMEQSRRTLKTTIEL